MAPLSIQVSGSSTITHYPEQAVLCATIRSESTKKESASKAVTTTSNKLHSLLVALSREANFDQTLGTPPVESHSSTSIFTGFFNGYDHRGEPTGPTYHASISYTIHFRYFSKLSEIVARLIEFPNIKIDSIEWCLTDETKQSLASESRKLAMQDAIQKANDYAELIGRKVVPAEISEDGDCDYQMSYVVNMPDMSVLPMCRPMMTVHHALKEAPQDIKLTGSVSVKFVAVDDA